MNIGLSADMWKKSPMFVPYPIEIVAPFRICDSHPLNPSIVFFLMAISFSPKIGQRVPANAYTFLSALRPSKTRNLIRNQPEKLRICSWIFFTKTNKVISLRIFQKWFLCDCGIAIFTMVTNWSLSDKYNISYQSNFTAVKRGLRRFAGASFRLKTGGNETTWLSGYRLAWSKKLRGEYHRLKQRPDIFWGMVSFAGQVLWSRHPQDAAAILCVKKPNKS